MSPCPTCPLPPLPHRRCWPPLALAALAALLPLLLAACQTPREVESDLQRAQQLVQQAEQDPAAAQYGAAEIAQARQTLADARAWWERRDNPGVASHLGYLAGRQAQAAQALGERGQHEQVLRDAEVERERIRLGARTREAEARSRDARARADSAPREDTRQRIDALQQQLQALQARPTPRGMVLSLGDVLFATGQARLFPGAQRSAERIARLMQEHAALRVRIEGHTDSRGSEDANQRLSERRAQALRDALVAQGIAADRIDTAGLGDTRPVASNASAAGRQQNRRVEVLFSDLQGRFSAPAAPSAPTAPTAPTATYPDPDAIQPPRSPAP